MQGKVCIVTGATAGIGEVTALELARKGATVVVISRSEAKCRATVDRIRAETGNGTGRSGNVDYLVADMASQASVRAVAAAFRAKYDRLDVLVNNADVLCRAHGECGRYRADLGVESPGLFSADGTAAGHADRQCAVPDRQRLVRGAHGGDDQF